MFSDYEIRRLSRWESISPGFVGGGLTFDEKVKPILMKIESIGRKIINQNVAENFSSVFISSAKEGFGEIKGHLIYFSLLGPYAALSRGFASVEEDSFVCGFIDPKIILSPDAVYGDYEQDLCRIIGSGGYHLFTTEQANAKTPADIQPYEYCLSDPPWNCVFNMFFSYSD